MAKQTPEAHKKSCRKYYEKNRAKYYLDNKVRKQRNREIVVAAKDKPCADCGHRFPSICMDFDHLYDKKFNISNARCSEETLRAEITKCEVVCANCHRIRSSDHRLTRQDTNLSSL